MNITSVGDLARLFSIRQSNFSLKSDIQNLSKEVTTGIKHDIPEHLEGDLVQLARLQSAIQRREAHLTAAQETASVANAMQDALGQIQDIAVSAGPEFMSDTSLSSPSTLRALAERSEHQLRSVIDTLNLNVAGRFAFSGTKADTPPLARFPDMMAQIEAVAAGATSAQDLIARVDAWFDQPEGGGGFLDTAFNGSLGSSTSAEVGDATVVRFDATAADSELREVMKGLAMATLVSRGAFANDQSAQADIMRSAGTAIMQGGNGLAFTRADLGMTQQTIESAVARSNQALTGLRIEVSDLVSADAYDSASRLIQTEAQLEALYSLTAKLSQRSLANYI